MCFTISGYEQTAKTLTVETRSNLAVQGAWLDNQTYLQCRDVNIPLHSYVSGGSRGYALSADGLPPGLTIAATTANITRASTASGDFPFYATARDEADGTEAKDTFYLTITVNPLEAEAGNLPGN